MNIKQNDKIVLNSSKSSNDIIINIQKNAKKYKRNNRLQNDILCKTRGNKFVIYIPWNKEKREFRGAVYDNKEGSLLEGRFLVPKRSLWTHFVFWMIVWTIIFFLFFYVPVLMKNNYFDIVFLTVIIFFLFDLWHLLIYRNKNYENKIIHFLKKCLKDDSLN